MIYLLIYIYSIWHINYSLLYNICRSEKLNDKINWAVKINLTFSRENQ